jgi:hypothetical protein
MQSMDIVAQYELCDNYSFQIYLIHITHQHFSFNMNLEASAQKVIILSQAAVSCKSEHVANLAKTRKPFNLNTSVFYILIKA